MIAAVHPEPRAQVAPTQAELWEHPEIQEDSPRVEIQILNPPEQPVDDLDRSHWPPGTHGPGGYNKDMIKWFSDRGEPTYGTKQVMWKRIMARHKRDQQQAAQQEVLARRLQERQEGQPEHQPPKSQHQKREQPTS